MGPTVRTTVQVESSNSTVRQHIQGTATLIRSAGGIVSDDFRVHETGGDFWCSVASESSAPGKVLLAYPVHLAVPLADIRWSNDPDSVRPVDGLSSLTAPQRGLLDHWVSTVNAVGKLDLVRSCLPHFTESSPKVRQQLVSAGFQTMATLPTAADATRVLIGWHSCAFPGDGAQPITRLIPLKHFVNHHPTGCDPDPIPGQVALVTSQSSSTAGTFENYGGFDMLQFFMKGGYVDDTRRVVHSVPVAVEGPAGWEITIASPRMRAARKSGSFDTPRVDVVEGSLRLSDLSARPGNRQRTVLVLEMLLRSQLVSLAEPKKEAECVLDQIAQANLEFYQDLINAIDLAQQEDDQLGPAGPVRHEGEQEPATYSSPLAERAEVRDRLKAVAVLQQELLNRFWG